MKKALLLAALVLIAPGCATITRSTSEAFAIETDPSGAVATLSTGQQCMTPCSLKVSRRSSFAVTIKKDGYEIMQTQVTSSPTFGGMAAEFGNVAFLFVGLIGLTVDSVTGAAHAHKPNPLVVKLVPLQNAN